MGLAVVCLCGVVKCIREDTRLLHGLPGYPALAAHAGASPRHQCPYSVLPRVDVLGDVRVVATAFPYFRSRVFDLRCVVSVSRVRFVASAS